MQTVMGERGEFWRRGAAGAIDFVILAMPVGVAVSFYCVAKSMPLEFLRLNPGETPAEVARVLGVGFLSVLLAAYLVGSWLYFALCESSVRQATPGKRILGLCVTDGDGRPVSFARASGRFFSGRLLAHVPTVGLAYFAMDCLVALGPGKQAIHDRVAGCVVRRARSSMLVNHYD